MTRYTRATPPKRVPARPLPRGTSLVDRALEAERKLDDIRAVLAR